MSYQAERQEIESNKKKGALILLIVVLVLLVALCTFSAFVPPDTWAYYVALPQVESRNDGELKIHFLDVGQGDSTLIQLPDGKTMLIDGGNGGANATKSMLRYLNACKIDAIDYLVLTHADADHCGGLARLLELKEVRAAYIPASAPETNGEYAAFYQKMMESGCSWQFVSRDVRIQNVEYGYRFEFLYPYQTNGEYEDSDDDKNENSAVIWLDYQGVSTLFTGDAPAYVEELLMEQDQLDFFKLREVDLRSTEILKVSHHGSADGTSAKFLEYLGLETAVISCGANNAYGHPNSSVLGRLQLAGATTYRTDINGHVCVTVSPQGGYTVKTIKNKK